MKKKSNRIYPSKKCKHCKNEFTPTDKRQVFCCEQHRIDYNNDKRLIKYAPIKAIITGLTKNDQILEKAYQYMTEKKKNSIDIDILNYDGFDFNIPTKISVTNAGNQIEWQISFGLEGIEKETKLFKIHKK